MSDIRDILRQPIHIPFGGGFDVPPPSARTGLRVQKIMAAIAKAEKNDEEVDMARLAARMGVADPDDYDMNVELLGEELYEKMLDSLTTDELGIVQQAMFIWVMPNGGRSKAELFLADPTLAQTQTEEAVSTLI